MAGSDAVNVARGEPESLMKPGTPLRRRAYLTPHTPSYIVAQPRQKSRRGANTMRLSTATERFLDTVRARGLSRSTHEAYASDLRLLVALASVQASDSVLAFDADLVRRYLVTLSEKNLSQATLHRRRASISEFAKWGKRERLWGDVADSIPAIKRPKNLPRPFADDERDRLMALDLDATERTLRGLLYYTALRVTPICGLRVGDLSFSPTRFSNGLEAPGSIRATSKGKKQSVKPMHPDLYRLLEGYMLTTHPTLDPRAWLFRQRDGRPWTRKMIEQRVTRWGQAARVPDCHPHRFRHTCATNLLEAGQDIRLVQVLLDHEDLSTTALYTKVTDARLAGAIAALPSFRPVLGLPLTGPASVPQPEQAN
jgi:site-specific recombinase XerD